MRCPTCGRFVGTDGPAWAMKCACGGPEHPCSGCPDTTCASCFGDGRVPEHPCAKCGGDRRDGCMLSDTMPDCAALRIWLAAVDMDGMVRAIRGDMLVGRGTCSSIDERMDDDDLRRELALAGCATVRDALVWAREGEEGFLERGLNQRWGEDDDGQLAAWREFKAANDANPPGAPSRNDGLGLVWDK